MDQHRHLRFLVSLFALALVVGCVAKKTAGPPMPPPSPASAAATPEPTPQPTPTPTQTQQSQLPAQGTPPPEPEPTQSAAKNDKKADGGKQHSGKKSPRETARNTPPTKITVPADTEAPATGGQISPSGQNVAPNDPSTDQLLQSTENNLNNLKGQLSQQDQTDITVIRDYISRSRQATRENDPDRARTLATKAHQLCDDLIKRR